MGDPWHELANFESRDLVFDAFKRRHGREPNSGRIYEITASFIQAREYFENAKRAAITVRPLLQYYGVASLTRGLILTVSAAKSAEALKPSHGLEPQNWKATLANGLQSFPDLAVVVRSGTFSELLEATGNRSYLKANSSAINWKVDFPQPMLGQVFSFRDVAAAMPDVASDYETWSGAPLISAQMDSLTHNNESKRYELSIQGQTKPEVIRQLFAELGNGVNIESTSGCHKVNIPDTYQLYFGQLTEGAFGIGMSTLCDRFGTQSTSTR
jgi:hypothetical protein